MDKTIKDVVDKQTRKLSLEEAISSPKHDLMAKAVSPPHYKGNNGLEVIDVIDAFNLDLYQGSIIQYVIRFKNKDGKQDLLKAKWYLDRLVAKWDKEHPPF